MWRIVKVSKWDMVLINVPRFATIALDDLRLEQIPCRVTFLVVSEPTRRIMAERVTLENRRRQLNSTENWAPTSLPESSTQNIENPKIQSRLGLVVASSLIG